MVLKFYFNYFIYMDIDITLPQSWREMNQEKLKYFFSLLAMGFSQDQIKTYCVFRWGGLEVVQQIGKQYMLKKNHREFIASPLLISSCCDCLSFLDEMPHYPVNLRKLGKHEALPLDFSEVAFKKFIIIDNMYQGYLATKREDLLDEMAKVLYKSPRVKMSPAQRMSIFYWWCSLKNYFSIQFKNFFSGSGSGEITGDKVKESMNAMIRALTAGDITKEKEVLAMDTWRALTELDAKAKEYEELERKYPTKN